MTADPSINNNSPITSDVPPGLPKPPLAERLANFKECLEARNQEYIKQHGKQYPYFVAFCDDPEKRTGFKPGRVAAWLKENDHFKTDRTSGIIYYGDEEKGVWDKNGEVHLQEILSKILSDENKAAHYTNILHDLKGLTYTDIQFSKKIAVENGLLDVETGELSPFNLDEMAFYSIPTRYDPKAACPDWHEFLKQVLPPEDIPTAQEWAGYTLLPDYRFHKVLWIHGEGRNGKGVFDRTIQGIIGPENCSSVGLEELDGTHRFALYQLYGKLYNISSEPATNYLFKTEIFQKVSGGDLISAERKGKDSRANFRNCSKLTVIGNKFPKVENLTVAFKERMIFVKFPNFFATKDRIPNLEKVWLENSEARSAILNWMLQGLRRLLSQGYFTESKNQQETEIEFQRVTDSTSAFQKERGIINKNLVTTRSLAMQAYYEYCDSIGIEPASKSEFTKKMQKLAPKVRDGWIYEPKKERAWLGFGLNVEVELTLDEKAQQEQQEQQKHLKEFSENEKSVKEENSVPTVPTVIDNPNPSVSSGGYEPLICYFCRKQIMTLDWTSGDGFTENKPAHNKCYYAKKAELREQEKITEQYGEPGEAS